MLMPRIQFNNFLPNMDIAPNMDLQHHHINQLLSTAAAGTGIVGDVDALLTPLSVQSEPLRLEPRPERNLWRNEEIIQMLNIMQNIGAVDLLNDKLVKSEKVFRDIEEIMRQNGFRKKSHAQIWTKWKFLKSTYTTSKRNGTVPKMIPSNVYEILHKMLCDGVNVNKKSKVSLDCDSSSGIGSTPLPNSNQEDAAVSNSKQALSEEDDEGFGMAHPIFGFRLGLVKQEPADTGYETITNDTSTEQQESDDQNTISANTMTDPHLQLQTQIKQEIDDLHPVSSPSPGIPSKPPTPPESDSEKTSVIVQPAGPMTTRVPAQGRVTQMQLPPLRIAPFAKEPLPLVNRLPAPPPPLAIQRRHTRLNTMNNSISNSNVINSTPGNQRINSHDNSYGQPQAKSTPKLAPAQISTPPLRLTKDIVLPSNGMEQAPRHKYGSVRKSPYSLRTERAVASDLTPAASPPVLRSHYNAYQDRPCTSQQALNASVMPKKRRPRLDIGWFDGEANRSPPEKIAKFFTSAANMSQNHHTFQESDNDDDDEEEDNFTHNSNRRSAQTRMQKSIASANDKNSKHPSKDEGHEYFEEALKDLNMSLRQMQREMLTDFFDKQMELARKEHDFQMQQDHLLMKAFEEQSQQYMCMAKILLRDDYDQFLEAIEKSKKVVRGVETETFGRGTHMDDSDSYGDEEDMQEQLSHADINATYMREGRHKRQIEEDSPDTGPETAATVKVLVHNGYDDAGDIAEMPIQLRANELVEND